MESPLLYSWPSKGALTSHDYSHDRESAGQAEPYLREFLEFVARETGAKSVSIIAHSMGNQLLLPALRELKRAAPAKRHDIAGDSGCARRGPGCVREYRP